MKVEYGTTLETATDSYTVLEPAGQGGFGTVYRVSREGDGKIFAVKFMQEPDVSGYRPKLAYECQSKVRRIFEEECWFLEKLGYLESKRRPLPFPRFYGKGELHDTPFYVMEWLEPVDLAAHNNYVKRIGYLSQVCHAVDILHREGYVLYDI